VSFTLTDLQAMSGYGDSVVGPDGSFTASGQPAAFAIAGTSSDKTVLLGMIIDGQPVELSARSTAAMLLYLALAGYNLKEPVLQQQLYKDILAAPELSALTTALEAAMRINPTVLHDGDNALSALVESTRNTLASRIVPKFAAKITNIDPTTELSGTTLQGEENGDVTATSIFRRHAALLHIYKTGTVKDGTTTRLPTAQEITPSRGLQYGGSASLASIGDLVGAGFNALFNVNAGGFQAFYASTQTLGASMFAPDSNADETLYSVIQIQPAFRLLTAVPDPAVFSDGQFGPFVGEWAREFNELNSLEVLVDLLLPLFSQLITGARLEKAEEEIATTIMLNLFNEFPNLQQRLAAVVAGNESQFPILVTDFFTLVGRGDVISRLAQAYSKNPNLNGRFLKAFANAVGPARAINTGLQLFDTLRIGANLLSSNKAERWNLTSKEAECPDFPGTWRGDLDVVLRSTTGCTLTATDTGTLTFPNVVRPCESSTIFALVNIEGYTFNRNTCAITGHGQVPAFQVNGTFTNGGRTASMLDGQTTYTATLLNPTLMTLSVRGTFPDGSPYTYNGSLTKQP